MKTTSLLRTESGTTISLEPSRWRQQPTPEEEEILDQVVGPALDVGCGPGRHVLALSKMGVPALGIDISPLAVTLARDRGATVFERCVFRPLPLSEAWKTVLLLDGNIGIGGCPTTLLRRVGQLLAPGGHAYVEVGAPGTPTGRIRVRVERGTTRGPWFVWAQVSASLLPLILDRTGLAVSDVWESGGRWFARLDRADHPATDGRVVHHWIRPDVGCAACGCAHGGTDVWATALSEGA